MSYYYMHTLTEHSQVVVPEPNPVLPQSAASRHAVPSQNAPVYPPSLVVTVWFDFVWPADLSLAAEDSSSLRIHIISHFNYTTV